MSLHVHFLRRLEPEAASVLLELLEPNIQITTGNKGLPPKDTHIIVSGRLERKHLDNCSSLRAVIVPWAGVPESTLELMQQFPAIHLHNLHHNADQTAELAIGLLLAAAKRMIPIDRAMRNHDWRPRYTADHSFLLAEKTALILGYGEIGQRVARICQAMRMEVTGVRRSPSKSNSNPDIPVYSLQTLHSLLPKTNVLVITLPLTEETKGLISKAELELLPDNSILVNVGRGPIVDEDALYEALTDKRLGALGLDVWYSYPENEESRKNTMPSKYPFHEFDNVVMSPHRGGNVIESTHQRMTHLANLLNAAKRGDPIPNRVDLSSGY